MKTSFEKWIKKQAGRCGCVGDLATDILRDKGIEDWSIEKLRLRLILKNACEEAKEALEKAYKEWLKTQ